MDKYFTLKMVKKYIAVLLIILLLFFCFLIYLFSYKSKIVYVLSFLFFILLILPGIITYLFVKIKNRNPRYVKNALERVVKEISNKYSPAICSLLYNEKIEAYSAYTATILDLEHKGYLKIRKNNNNYAIDVLKKDYDKLNKHEKFVMRCICNEEAFDIIKFKNNIFEDAISLNVIEQNESKDKRDMLVLILMIVFFAIIIAFIFFHMYLSIILIILVMSFIVIAGTNLYIEDKYILTAQGKKLKKQVMGFKYYIKEYTLLEKRDIEEKELFKDYIAYALSLGETKILQEFVKTNEQYRYLIYK